MSEMPIAWNREKQQWDEYPTKRSLGEAVVADEEIDVATGYPRTRQAAERDLAESLQREKKLGELIDWMAQTVHQAYHTGISETFRECPRSVCRAAVDKKELARVNFA